jgi:hypothetical protein
MIILTHTFAFRYSLRNSIFGANLINTSDILDILMETFDEGTKTELVLNVLTFSDLSRWEQKRIRKFVDIIKEIVKASHDKNRILLCYNPILTICLSCEYL